jgi:hypothetical protein
MLMTGTMAAKRRAWFSYCVWLITGALLGAIAGAAFAAACMLLPQPNYTDKSAIAVMAMFGGFAGLFHGEWLAVGTALAKRNAPRWCMCCAWVGGGTVCGTIDGAVIGAGWPTPGWGFILYGFFGGVIGALMGASVGGLVVSELLKRRA